MSMIVYFNYDYGILIIVINYLLLIILYDHLYYLFK